MIAELLPYLEDLLALGHMGVVVRMAEVAVRFMIKQKKMLKALLRAFHCEGKVERSSAVVLISSLTTYEIFFGTKPEPDEREKDNEEKNDSVSKTRRPWESQQYSFSVKQIYRNSLSCYLMGGIQPPAYLF